MGNGLAKLASCLPCAGGHRHLDAAVTSEPFDEGLGHSFWYVRPDPPAIPATASASASSKVHHNGEEGTTFRSISGASVSANPSTALSTSLLSDLTWPSAAAFESSTSFSAVPLHPVPRFPSGPLDRGFQSGPIERGFMSGPLDRPLFSGPLDRPVFSGTLDRPSAAPLRRSVSHSLLRGLTRAIARTVWGPKQSDDPMSAETDENSNHSDAAPNCRNLQWAQGKAGEDRVHLVISEEHGWVFVGIYDGFNGPDATDYLLSNLYSAVQQELKGLLWDDDNGPSNGPTTQEHPTVTMSCKSEGRRQSNKRRWKYEWDKERLEMEQRLKEQLSSSDSRTVANHSEVLKALALGLKKTEEAYLNIADMMASENPELGLMGSCVLVMLMKGEDVYLMNVGDSRAVLAREQDMWDSLGKPIQDLVRIREETMHDLEVYDGGDQMDVSPSLAALQLTLDHSTCVEEEVRRIRKEHPDDASAVMNDRVKGSLKVTRAFGAGFLKQPKWNNALLEMFRIDYVGTSAYITCSPFIHHHRLVPNDRFLILSSDGLYQYFTNEEAVAQVDLFIATNPEGDPAQHLVEEVLFRAAEKAGMDFHELLEIPQGDRRRYHDDVSIIIISLEGRIWSNCM